MKQSAKYSLALLCLVCLIFVCGFGFKFRCAKHKALLLFNSQPITNQTINNAGRHFKAGEKIYYILINEEGFKDEYIRVQLVKKEQKTKQQFPSGIPFPPADAYFRNPLVLP